MSRKERARIARANSAKSQRPITAEGKAASSQNANTLPLPPHHAVLSNEDSGAYHRLHRELTAIYQPVNQIAQSIVQEIATAHWQIARLNNCLTTQWNLAIAGSADNESETMARAAQKLYSSGAVAHRINRQIDQLQLRIARLERRIKFVHANFPTAAIPPAETKTQINEPAVGTAENNPDAINTGKQQFPHHKIVVMPPDNATKGIGIDDGMPAALSRAA